MKNNFVAKFMNRFNRSSIEQDNRQELLDKIELLEADESTDNLLDQVKQRIEHLSGQELADELYKSKEKRND